MIQKAPDLREIYVWEMPVRFFHWINACVIVGLCITGYLIGSPLPIQSAAAPANQYWFGTIRFIHFVLAFIFIINFLIRVYWLFAGNAFARWRNYFPLRKIQWIRLYETLKVEALLTSPKPQYEIGHNSLAATTYGALFILIILQGFTGMMLYSVASNAFWAPMFTSMLIFFDGFFPIRTLHHWFMWGFILFAIVHVYLVFYNDYVQQNGVTSSMIGGWKFIPKEIVLDYEREINLQKEIEILKKEVKLKRKRLDLKKRL